jgi:hypothetical protein
MTTETLIHRVESGEVVCLDQVEDVIETLNWVKRTTRDLRGWLIQVDDHMLWVSFDPELLNAEKRRAMCS